MISLSNVHKNYGSQQVLRDISITIKRGELTAISGPSGSGKSTLLNIIAGLDRPDQGTVSLAGENVTELSNEALAALRLEKIGIIFQFFNLLPTLSILQNTALPARLRGQSASEAEAHAEALLLEVGVSEMREKFPHQLSGGEIQRCAIARALINDPTILLADEPTGNLDRKNGEIVMEQLVKANRDKGLTVVLVSHDPQLIHQAPNIICLADGRVQ